MSYGLAGALMGGGRALMDVAKEKRQEAQRLLEMKEAQQHDKDMLQMRADMSKKSRSGGRRGSGGGKSGRNFKWTNSDDVRVNEAWKSFYGEDATFDGEAPDMVQFRLQVKRNLEQNPNVSRDEAVLLARQQWQGTEQEEQFQRPERFSEGWFDGDDTTSDTRTIKRYGFNSAVGEPPAQSESPAPTPEQAASPTAPEPTLSPSASPSPAPSQSRSRAQLRTPEQAEHPAVQEARIAIARGAPRETVIARLRQMGINPEGL